MNGDSRPPLNRRSYLVAPLAVEVTAAEPLTDAEPESDVGAGGTHLLAVRLRLKSERLDGGVAFSSVFLGACDNDVAPSRTRPALMPPLECVAVRWRRRSRRVHGVRRPPRRCGQAVCC